MLFFFECRIINGWCLSTGGFDLLSLFWNVWFVCSWGERYIDYLIYKKTRKQLFEQYFICFFFLCCSFFNIEIQSKEVLFWIKLLSASHYNKFKFNTVPQRQEKWKKIPLQQRSGYILLKATVWCQSLFGIQGRNSPQVHIVAKHQCEN